MKKILMVIALCAICSASKANLIVDNDIGCDVDIVIFAHDMNHLSPCAFYSNRIHVPAGGPDGNFPFVAAIYPWFDAVTGAYVTAVNAQSGWDAVRVYVLDGGFTINGTVGVSGCGVSTTWAGSNPDCATVHVKWIVSGANTIIDITP